MLLIVLYSLTIFTSSSTRESSKEVGNYVSRKGEKKIWDTLKYSEDNNISYLEALERMDGKAPSKADKIRIVELIEEYKALFHVLLLYNNYLKRYKTGNTGELERFISEYYMNKILDDIEKAINSLDKIAQKIG